MFVSIENEERKQLKPEKWGVAVVEDRRSLVLLGSGTNCGWGFLSQEGSGENQDSC